ncbi:MAG: hypothetical protein HY000_19565 [Planctomycetes bacterium]|nr:hypothetical protein [Planctomycetota bacterium]
MTRTIRATFVLLALGLRPCWAQESQSLQLRYKFQPGQVLDFDVVQTAEIEMTVQGQTTLVTNDTTSLRRWKVREVDAQGTANIEISTERVHMRSTEGEQTIEFDSADPAKQPEALRHVAPLIGKPLSLLRVSPQGAVLEEKLLMKAEGVATMEAGQILPLLPERPVSPGQSWKHQFTLKLPKGLPKDLPARQTFKLADVKDVLATIEFTTAILAPIDDPQIEAQLVQHRPAGTVQFDLRRGLIVAQTLSVDETVVGFAGPASSFRIKSKYSERLAKPSAAE